MCVKAFINLFTGRRVFQITTLVLLFLNFIYLFQSQLKSQLNRSSVFNNILTFSLLGTCYLFICRSFSKKLLYSLFEIPFSKRWYQKETNLPIYITNQGPRFHMILILLRGISEETLFPNKHYAKQICMIFKYLSIIY